jgi:signal transduction histidine kinase/ActR/RegA family two-component response regulator/Tfp pilus assembly protein PilF
MQSKHFFLAIVLFGFCLNTQAQTFTKVKQDSLMFVWEDTSQPDIDRLNAVQEISQEGYRFKNPDSAFYYAQLQYDFARSIKNKEFQVRALNAQGDVYLLKGDPDKAFDILTSALKLSEELSDKKSKINTLGNISRMFELKGDLEKALDYNLQILSLSEEIQDTLTIGKSLATIGENYVRKGDLASGLEHLNRSKRIFEALDNQYNIVKVQSLMANIYMQQGNPDEALKFLTINQVYFEKTGNKTLLAGCLSNIGGVYAIKGDPKKALQYLEKALAHFEETGNTPYIAGISQNIGRIYYDEGNLERALEYATKSLKLAKKTKNENVAASAKQEIGIILADQGKHTQAISYGNEALAFFQTTHDVMGISLASRTLVKSYRSIENYKKAFEMNELHFQMRDSLNSKENQKAIIELQVQSEYEKQKALDDLENQKEIAIEAAKADAQRKISWAIGAGLFLISILAFIIFNRLKVTRKQKAVIEEQKNKVEQSEKYKEQFLANMSHEIRTPMHAISGMIKILERNEHPSTQDAYLNAMRTSSENLVVILNDVLDLSKIEAGKLEIKNTPMNPRLVVENVCQILKYKAEEKGLTLSNNVANEVPGFVMGDPTRLNQILINLAGNAIKFTQKGSVNISVSIEDEQLHFEVNDTGIGIPKKEQESIFGAFKQAKDSTTRHFGGTGLGLSISKQLVELQKGKIWLESTEGSGSTFYATLPLQIANAGEEETDLISEEKLKMMTASLQGIHILIAEDNPFNQMIAQDDLSYYINGVSISTVGNGALAVEKFKKNTYDLILMDVQMPEMNGFEAVKKIREIEKLENRDISIPIIAMTASLMKTEIDSCYKVGMDNYIPKPYTIEELIRPIFNELKTRV